MVSGLTPACLASWATVKDFGMRPTVNLGPGTKVKQVAAPPVPAWPSAEAVSRREAEAGLAAGGAGIAPGAAGLHGRGHGLRSARGFGPGTNGPLVGARAGKRSRS